MSDNPISVGSVVRWRHDRRRSETAVVIMIDRDFVVVESTTDRSRFGDFVHEFEVIG